MPESEGGNTDDRTKQPRHFRDDIANLFFWWQLDFLGDLVHEISMDIYTRPQTWRNSGSGLAGILADLRVRSGTDRRVPSTEQRMATFSAVFSPNFTSLSQQVLAASAAFVERQVVDP